MRSASKVNASKLRVKIQGCQRKNKEKAYKDQSSKFRFFILFSIVYYISY